jgi:predicted ATP-dependent serine protease
MSAEIFTDAAGRQFESTSKGWRAIDEVIERVESRFESNGDGRLEEQVAGNGHRSTIRASEIVARNVEWLWPDRVPLGMTSVFAGFPGVGKSTILYDLSARISREGRAVLIATAEDHLAHVVRPRLEAAGADLDLVHVVDADITLPEGIGELRKIVTELDVSLVILDPLVAFISEKVNSHRDHHVRRVLAPLAELAEETKAAIVVVIHTNKGNDTEPLMRISGSIGFTGAARSVLWPLTTRRTRVGGSSPS